MAPSINSTLNTYKVFYRDYEKNISISSSNPEVLNVNHIKLLAENLLQHADNFLGIVDKNDLILQAYLDDDEQNIFLELIFPERKDFLQTRLKWSDAFDLLSNLPREFIKNFLPNANFIK